jgi:hypothetical protein
MDAIARRGGRMTLDLRHTPAKHIAAELGCSLTTAQKLRRRARAAAGLPATTPPRRDPRGTVRGWRQLRGPR